jgi:hypothetical protein
MGHERNQKKKFSRVRSRVRGQAHLETAEADSQLTAFKSQGLPDAHVTGKYLPFSSTTSGS